MGGPTRRFKNQVLASDQSLEYCLLRVTQRDQEKSERVIPVRW